MNQENNEQAEMIKKIESLGGKNDPSSSLSIDDQLAICEILNETNNTNVTASVKWNDTYKHPVNTSSTEHKINAIKLLKTFTYITPPIQVAETLEILFSDHPAKEGHWKYIARTYTPRAINRVFVLMIKQHKRGVVDIQNPSAYFTNLIQQRKKRRSL